MKRLETLYFSKSFNTQPPEGGWVFRSLLMRKLILFQHTAARRRLGLDSGFSANVGMFQHTAARRRLVRPKRSGRNCFSFNTQPPEGGWAGLSRVVTHLYQVSTHSRPKAAGASLKSLAPSGFAAPISLGSQEKRERKYNTAFSVTPAFAIS